jgi:hypothetical protein
MNKQIRLITALAFGMALLSISTLANAEVILNVTQGTLVAKGAGVDLSVQITCNQSLGDSSANFGGVLTQRTGNSIASANLSFGETLTCTGVAQNLDILVAVNSSGKPFKQGPAFINITAQVFSLGVFQGDSGASQQEIHILH